MALGALADERNRFKWLLRGFENYEYNSEPTKMDLKIPVATGQDQEQFIPCRVLSSPLAHKKKR